MVKERVEVEYKLNDKASKGLKSLGGRFGSLLKILSNPLLIGTAIAVGMAKLGQVALKASAQLEQYQISFEVMLGSAEKAKDLLKEINEVAVKTPFEQTEIIKSTQSLLAFGVAQEDVIDTFKILGDISQGNVDKLTRLTRAYGKVQAKGKASMEEIQMTAEAGVPIIAELAKTLNVTTDEVFKLSQQGKITSKVFNKAMSGMTEEGGQFYESMSKQSQTLNGMLSTFKGNVELIAQAMGQFLLPIAKKVLAEINRNLTAIIAITDKVSEFIERRKEQFEEMTMTEDELAERDIQRAQKVADAKLRIKEEEARKQKILDDKKAKEEKKKNDALGKAYIASIEAQADKELSIEQQVAQGTLQYVKDSLLAKLSARSAQLASEGLAELPLALVGNPSGLLKLLASATMQAVGQTAINSVQLQEGGIIDPSNGGTNATIGEAGGSEAVIPLDEPEAQGLLGGNEVNVYIDMRELAKEFYEVNTEQLATGELQGR